MRVQTSVLNNIIAVYVVCVCSTHGIVKNIWPSILIIGICG